MSEEVAEPHFKCRDGVFCLGVSGKTLFNKRGKGPLRKKPPLHRFFGFSAGIPESLSGLPVLCSEKKSKPLTAESAEVAENSLGKNL